MKNLILASASPRRRELMEKLHRPFRVLVSDAEERVPEETRPEDVPAVLASQKAKNVFARLSSSEQASSLVIGSDTIVLCGGRILGKPHSEKEACRMLRMLSGKTHTVVTGVCLLSIEKELSFRSCSDVCFYPLTDEEILTYVKTGEPMDKAGAYGVQGDGALLVKKIDGDFYTVMGFPIAEIARRIQEF